LAYLSSVIDPGAKPQRAGGAGGAAEEALATTEATNAGPQHIFGAEMMSSLFASAQSVTGVAPILQVEPFKMQGLVTIPLQLDVIVFSKRSSPLVSALDCLQAQLLNQIQQLARQFPPTLTAATAASLRPVACVLQPPPLLLPLTTTYLLTSSDDDTEPSGRAARELLHKRLALPTDRPLLRSTFAMGDATTEIGTPIPGLLRDVHLSLPLSGMKGGTTSCVQGSYEYFHYMQWTGNGQLPKSYDDAGWGCAYRSLMSIVSWFRLQQYTKFPNPTHYEIQKRLVDHCGQSADELLGKKLWLGSQDLALFLDHALGVTCKILECPTGDDVSANGRVLAHHFETQGTPVMIGGGQLAFTLIGVDFNDRSGEVRFLIMDPHYTGVDEIAQICPKWVGWKAPDSVTHLGTKLFQRDTYYNLCLPQRPRAV